MTLGEKIHAARSEADLTRSQLAAKIGVSRRAVSLWERGEREPKWHSIARIADATGRPVAWFLEEAA